MTLPAPPAVVPPPESDWSRWWVLVGGLLFAAAHTQSPLYYSNQNQYMLHGLADAGVGHLRHDWLAATRDPTPLFSAGVAALARLPGPWAFQAVFVLAQVGYFACLWRIAKAVPGFPTATGGRVLWAGLLTAAHAGVVRFTSDRLLGADYPWFLHVGLANQYILGPGLQPSVAGLLLLAAVALLTARRPILAAGVAASAGWLHATYLLPAAMLVAGLIVAEVAAGRWKAVWRSGGLALLVASPVVGHTVTRFGPTSPEAFDQAQRILCDVRIPHHCRPARWFDWVAGVQLGWMAAGLWLLRRTPVGRPLAGAAGLAAALSAVAISIGDATLALLFPWRLSAVLVPVSTAAVFAAVIGATRIRTANPRDMSATANALTSPLEGEVGEQSEPGGGYDTLSPPTRRVAAATTATSPSRGEVRNPPNGWRSGSGVGYRLWAGIALIAVSVVGAGVVYAQKLGYREPEGEDPALAFVRQTATPADVYLIPVRFPKPTAARGVYAATFAKPPSAELPVFFELAPVPAGHRGGRVYRFQVGAVPRHRRAGVAPPGGHGRTVVRHAGLGRHGALLTKCGRLASPMW